MSATDFDSPLTVIFEGEKPRATTNISSWSIDSNYLVSTDGFEFEMFDEDPENLSGLEGAPVQLVVNGATQLIGRIDSTTRGQSARSIVCRGRDYLADMVECNIDPTMVVKEGETLGNVILRACAPIGITKIDAESSSEASVSSRKGGVKPKSSNRGPNPGSDARKRNLERLNNPQNVEGSLLGPPAIPNPIAIRQSPDNFVPAAKPEAQQKAAEPHDSVLQDMKPQIGEGIYQFLKPLCDRHECTIQPSTSRDTVLVAGPLYNQDPSYMLTRIDADQGSNNNIISATATRDYSSFPTLVIVQGHGAPRAGEPTGSAVQLIDSWAQAQSFRGELGETVAELSWSGRRKPGGKEALPVNKIYRLNVFRDDKARSKDQISKAAKRLLTEHLRKTLEYKVVVRGHIDPITESIWTVNTIVQVDDDPCDIHELLWIQSRTLKYDGKGGATTELLLVRPQAFDFKLVIKEVANAGAGKKKKTKEEEQRLARQKAAEKFVAENFGIEQGPPDIIKGFR